MLVKCQREIGKAHHHEPSTNEKKNRKLFSMFGCFSPSLFLFSFVPITMMTNHTSRTCTRIFGFSWINSWFFICIFPMGHSVLPSELIASKSAVKSKWKIQRSDFVSFKSWKKTISRKSAREWDNQRKPTTGWNQQKSTFYRQRHIEQRFFFKFHNLTSFFCILTRRKK